MLIDCPLSRRSFLAGTGALFAWSFMPAFASAAQGRDPRFLTIILRGGLDGLSAVPAVGDPDYVRLRRDLAMPTDGPNAVLPLDGFFALNARMTHLHRLYRNGQALILHAAATPYRERSHFDGQDVLETGLDRPGGRDGWLNRALAALPRGERLPKPRGLAIGATVPLILQGSESITSWSPQVFPPASEETVRRLLALYEARDPVLARALAEGVDIGRTAARQGLAGLGRAATPEGFFADQAMAAARLMSLEDGPRVAAMSFDGWDTHADQGPQEGRLARLLAGLDAAIGALEQGLAPVWPQTVVAIVTEFGRTARGNGTDGTDHGTATVAFLVGGAVAGGRVVADWPGLTEARLYQNRDLAPTMDLRAALKGVLADHLGLSARTLSERVFPGSAGAAPIGGLLRV
jgi:uncharacterized protein (DUF1501 family)